MTAPRKHYPGPSLQQGCGIDFRPRFESGDRDPDPNPRTRAAPILITTPMAMHLHVPSLTD